MRTVFPPTPRALALTLLLAASIAPITPAHAAEPAASSTTPTPAPSVQRSANSTTVSASLKYSDGSKSDAPVWTNIRLSITRDGEQLATDLPLPDGVSSSYFAAPKLLAVDLDDDADPEVMVDVFTAGFACCRRTALFHLVDRTYQPTILDWGETSYRLADVVGGASPEFVTTDGRFPGLFRSDGRGPIRILGFTDGRVSDQSPRAREELARDARIHRRAWSRITRAKRGDARTAVAAYAVDLVRLGEVDAARSAIKRAAKRRELRSSAARFARRIDGRMMAWGYTSKPTLAP